MLEFFKKWWLDQRDWWANWPTSTLLKKRPELHANTSFNTKEVSVRLQSYSWTRAPCGEICSISSDLYFNQLLAVFSHRDSILSSGMAEFEGMRIERPMLLPTHLDGT